MLDTPTMTAITVGMKGSKGMGGATPANDGVDGVAQAILMAP
jgi:hypothetical protein